jgi:hypothetical protein
MSVHEILRRHGAPALLLFVGLVGLFVTLHLVRLPLLALVTVLAWAMRQVDATVTTRLTAPARPSPAAAGAGAGGGRR